MSSKREPHITGYLTDARAWAKDTTLVVIPDGEVRLQQLVVAPFSTARGSSYSLLGLGADGVVYRFDPQCDGWIRWSMKVAGCRMKHKGKR